MTNFVGQKAPDFTSLAIMPDGRINEAFNLTTHVNGRYAVIFFYTMNFAYVDPMEILAFQNRLPAFQERQCEVIGISCDSHLSHMQWRYTPVAQGGIGQLGFPLVSDISRRVAKGYEVLVNDAVAMRATFLLDQMGVVRLHTTYDLPIGRNVDEILRTLDALQFHEKNGLVTPPHWKKGAEAIAPTTDGVKNFVQKYGAAA